MLVAKVTDLLLPGLLKGILSIVLLVLSGVVFDVFLPFLVRLYVCGKSADFPSEHSIFDVVLNLC